jgi:hypothetical protein
MSAGTPYELTRTPAGYAPELRGDLIAASRQQCKESRS